MIYGQNQTGTEQTVTQEQRESYLALVNYCYEHADRPNPIQDLIDKGFLSPEFKGETCISVKQTYNTIIRELAIRQEKLDKAFAEERENNARYIECARNESTTFEECNRIREGIK